MSHRVARNSLLNLVGLGLPLLVGVVAMPPVVEGLGPDRFGVLGLVWVVLASLALLDLGLGRATTRFAAEALAHGDVDALRGVVTLAIATQAVIALVGGGLVALLALPLVESVLDIPAPLEPEAVRTFQVLALGAPLLVLANTFRGLLEAAHRFGVVNAVRAPTSAANFLVPLVGVLLGWSLPAIVGGVLLVRAIALLAYAGVCVRAWPGLRRPGLPARHTARTLLGFGGWVTVSSVISPLLVYVDRFVIGAVLNVAALGYYTPPHEMVSRLTVLPFSLASALFPAFAAGHANQSGRDRVSSLFGRSTKYLLALTGPPLIVLCVLAPDVLRYWLNEEFAVAGAPVLRWMAVGMILNSLAYLPFSLLQARGRPDLTAQFHLLELPIHLALLWVLIQQAGIAGAAAAWTLRVGLDAALLFGAVLKLRLVGGRALTGDRLPALAGSLLGLAAAGLLAMASFTGPAVRVGVVALLGVLWYVAAWRVLMSPDERRDAARVLGMVGAADGAGSDEAPASNGVA